ncbi:MAG TPA: hypothetical protein VFE62_07510 [Gemmataceae bacterium]|nr:hypothetical protein [Gemmataceae bacterium]
MDANGQRQPGDNNAIIAGAMAVIIMAVIVGVGIVLPLAMAAIIGSWRLLFLVLS